MPVTTTPTSAPRRHRLLDAQGRRPHPPVHPRRRRQGLAGRRRPLETAACRSRPPVQLPLRPGAGRHQRGSPPRSGRQRTSCWSTLARQVLRRRDARRRRLYGTLCRAPSRSTTRSSSPGRHHAQPASELKGPGRAVGAATAAVSFCNHRPLGRHQLVRDVGDRRQQVGPSSIRPRSWVEPVRPADGQPAFAPERADAPGRQARARQVKADATML